MLPKDAFLRKHPNIVDEVQGIQIEALVFSADSVEFSFNAIKTIAIGYREKIADAPDNIRTGMFIHAWNIVDSLHVIRQVMRSFEGVGTQTKEFLRKYEVATRMRNKMDHLSGNALNISKASNRTPIYGSLSYACVPEQEIEIIDGQSVVTGAGIVVVSAGRLVGKSSISLVNPAGMVIEDRAALFQLDAFGELLKIEEAVTDLKDFIIHVNEGFELECQETAEKISAETGIAMKTLMANAPAGLTVYISVKFDADVPSASPDMTGSADA